MVPFEVQKQFDLLFMGAEHIIASHEVHHPMFFIEKNNGNVLLYDLTNICTDEQKQSIPTLFYGIGEDPSVKMISWVAEAHTRVVPDNMESDPVMKAILEGRMKVKDALDAEEVVMFHVLTNGRRWTMSCPVDHAKGTLKRRDIREGAVPNIKAESKAAVKKLVKQLLKDK